MTEFLNSLDYSISGFIYVRTTRLRLGPACTANGFTGQLTYQAIDFTMLAIVITALLTITQKVRPESVSPRKKWIICASTWVMPIITSIAAVSLRSIAPIGGNWCWISAAQPGIQYALAHGWRIAIIFTIVLLYACLCWTVYARFRARPDDSGQSSLNRSKLGSLCSEASPKDDIAAQHSRTGPNSCDGAGPWLPIQSPGPFEKSPPRTTKTDIFTSPRRQVDHINSLYHLGPPPRIHTPRQESRQEDREDWLREILSISRCIKPVRKSLENRRSMRNSSDTGSDFPIQLPEASVDEKSSDGCYAARPDASTADAHAAIDTTGPAYHSQCPKVTKSFQASVDYARTAPENRALIPAPLDVKPGPNYQNQCPKVTKSIRISIDDANMATETTYPEAAKPGPRYHNQCPKVTRTVDVSMNRISTPPMGNTETPGPRYHSQCPKVTRTIDVSRNRFATPYVDADETPGPRYHNQCPKVTRTVDVSTDRVIAPYAVNADSPGPRYHNQCPRVTRTVGVSVDRIVPPSPLPSETPGPNYHNQCPKVTRTIAIIMADALTLSPPSIEDYGPQNDHQCPKVPRSFGVTVDQGRGNSEEEPGPRYHNQCPKVTRSVNVSTSQAGPNYHSECPLVKRTISVSVDPMRRPQDADTDASPRYHSQRPKVKRSFQVSYAGHGARPSCEISAAKPLPPPPPALLVHKFKTETTILTSPMDPPPSPTPGLPPPPWSPTVNTPGSRIQFKKPAIFRKSTWSDSSHSSRNLDPVTPWATVTTRKATLSSRIKNVSQGLRSRCSSVVTNLRGFTHDINDYDDDDGTASSASEREVRRALLLSAYPLAYVILWLPWVVERFMEAEGVQAGSSRAMAALLACPQWIPLANALALGVSVYLRGRAGRRRRSGSGPGSLGQASSRRSFWIF